MKTNYGNDRRLGWILWPAGMSGVIAVNVQVLPRLLRDAPSLPIPLWLVYVSGSIQSGALLGLMVLIGLKFGPVYGLGAPILADRAAWPAGRLARTLLPALGAGLAAGVLLVLLSANAPAELPALEGKVSFPLLSLLLFGGITEDLLMRWV